MNQYKGGKGNDRQTWLSFWNGATVLVNRKSRKEPLTIDNPLCRSPAVFPPEVLGELADERGREDGFVHRILFACPAPCDLVWTEASIPNTIQEKYATVVEQLQALPWAADAPETCAPRIVPLPVRAKPCLSSGRPPTMPNSTPPICPPAAGALGQTGRVLWPLGPRAAYDPSSVW